MDAIAMGSSPCVILRRVQQIGFSTHQLAQGVRMSYPKVFRFATIFVSLLLLPLGAFAQSSNGSISGTITDESGGALPGVTVTATNADTHASRSAVSNSVGHYEIPLLPPATYSAVAELAGFQQLKYEKVVVNVGSDVTLNLKMRPGVTEMVTVTAAAPIIETTKSEVSSVVNDKA